MRPEADGRVSVRWPEKLSTVCSSNLLLTDRGAAFRLAAVVEVSLFNGSLSLATDVGMNRG